MAAVVVIFGPWWLSLVRDLIAERQARALAEERAQMAAHVHDSVLQTLALIQRSADDPQNALVNLGWPILGEPRWTLVGLPKTVVEPLEFGFLLLGLAGTMAVAWRLAQDDSEEHTARAFAPWAVVGVLLFAASVWLMMQPMDMRATMMAG